MLLSFFTKETFFTHEELKYLFISDNTLSTVDIKNVWNLLKVDRIVFGNLIGTSASMLLQKSRTFPSVSGPITERIGIFQNEI